MSRKVSEILVLGSSPIANVMASILHTTVVDRTVQGTGWNWPKIKLAERVRLLFVTSSRDGVDRIIRHQAEAWNCPKVARIGVLILVPNEPTRLSLLNRDVFGRKGRTDARFQDYSDVLRVVSANASLQEILSNLASVEQLPVDTWHREACGASLLSPLMEAIKSQDSTQLLELLPQAVAVHWDSICFPTAEFPNPHDYANAVDRWIQSVTMGVTPDWKRGLDLFTPLTAR